MIIFGHKKKRISLFHSSKNNDDFQMMMIYFFSLGLNVTEEKIARVILFFASKETER